ncbi:hypothetical protein NQ057_24375, partial [Escherichia coli]|uniref:hypothetical protein n=1 Tax=Escherichia coli TaxID=562 RepID=UPI0023F87AFC
HRRLACEPGGCSAPVAGYSACLTSFTSSIRFSLHAYGSYDPLTRRYAPTAASPCCDHSDRAQKPLSRF